jgi:hypothetical protein
MTTAAKESFLPNHKHLSDEELLVPPAGGVLTPLTLFVCTYVARLSNLHHDFVGLAQLMCKDLHGCILAVNSNYGHAAQPGSEAYIKVPKVRKYQAGTARSRERKFQGDGTCFNSAIEPIIHIEHPNIPDDKIYKCKCFPTTGETQVPGVILTDFSDGHAVLVAFVDYLNEMNVGDLEPVLPGESPQNPPARKKIEIFSEQPKMINYKFRLQRTSPRILVNLFALAAYLSILERTKVVEGAELTADQVMKFAGWPVVVLPPFPVREVKTPNDDVKVSFHFQEATRKPRINIFQEGKINILGADSTFSADKIYAFFTQLLISNWGALVALQPRRDLEVRAAQRAVTKTAAASATAASVEPPVPRPPPVMLSDADVDEVLAEALAEISFVGGDSRDVVENYLASTSQISRIENELQATRHEINAQRARIELKQEELDGLSANLRELFVERRDLVAGMNYEELAAADALMRKKQDVVDNVLADLGQWGIDGESNDGSNDGSRFDADSDGARFDADSDDAVLDAIVDEDAE